MRPQLSFPFVTLRQRVVSAESTLTETEALAIARRELGPDAYTCDRNTLKTSCQSSLPRFYVGIGQECYGNGATWEAALEAALRMATRKAARP
jgi:hypothetical protein